MPKVILRDEQFNIYVRFLYTLNVNKGKIFGNSAVYYDFLDSELIEHKQFIRILDLVLPRYKNNYDSMYPYVHYRTERDSKTPWGEFYLTTNGRDIVCNLSKNAFPPLIKIRKPKPKQEIEQKQETSPVENCPDVNPNWTREDVVALLTKEAHIVGRMLGNGYDLLEEIHGDWLREWLLNPRDFKIVIHQAHRGSFKCFAPNTKVMMADGTSKEIKDVKLGDYVMGWDSKPRKVIDKYSGVSPMYRVTLNKNGEYYECNNNHILTLRQRPIKHNKFHCVDKYRYEDDRNIINIPIEEFLNSPASKTNGNTKETFFKHFKVGVDFDKQEVKIPPYILGCWIGDGSSDRIAITTMDEEIRQEFKQWCEGLGLSENVWEKKNKPNKAKTYGYSVKGYCKPNDNKALNMFKEYKLLGNKHIPHCYLQNDRETRLQLLAGLLDTDGNYCNLHYTYTTKLEPLAKQVEWLARSLGFNSTAKKIKTWCVHNGEKRETFAWQVYINGTRLGEIPVRLERKRAISKGGRASKGSLSFSQTIEPIGEGEFVGITIEGDGMFLLDNFLVVHNSTCLRLMIAIFMILKPLVTVIVVRKSEDAVKELVGGVSKILDTPLFHAFVNILYPDIAKKGGFKKVTDTALAIDTNLNTNLSGEMQLRALGLGSPLTGKHAELIITDDIVTTDDRISPAARMETIYKYQELMNVLSSSKAFKDSRILNIGTPWHEEDAFSLMEKGLPDKSNYQLRLERIPTKQRTDNQNELIRKGNMARGLFVYNCYQTGLMTEEEIQRKKKTLNDDVLFAANYMLSLVSDDEKPFPKINNTSKYSNSFFDEAWEVYAQIDCSYGGADSTALSIGAFNWDTHEAVVYGKLYKGVSIDENYLDLLEEMTKCNVTMLFLESNADKGLMGEKFREFGMNVTSYHESTNKHNKIITSIRPYWRESAEEYLPCLQFTKETDSAYLSQIHDYKQGVKHDDAPDSLAVLLIKAKFSNLPIRIT